jgi:hypothetical protein
MSRSFDVSQAAITVRRHTLSTVGLIQLFVALTSPGSAWPLTRIAVPHAAAPPWFAAGLARPTHRAGRLR